MMYTASKDLAIESSLCFGGDSSSLTVDEARIVAPERNNATEGKSSDCEQTSQVCEVAMAPTAEVSAPGVPAARMEGAGQPQGVAVDAADHGKQEPSASPCCAFCGRRVCLVRTGFVRRDGRRKGRRGRARPPGTSAPRGSPRNDPCRL